MAGSSAPRSGYALPVDLLNELGDPGDAFKSPTQLQFLRTLISIIRAQFGKSVTTETAVGFIYLRSPNGNTFRVTVGDDGTLQATNARLS
jgi:hypothetical protein